MIESHLKTEPKLFGLNSVIYKLQDSINNTLENMPYFELCIKECVLLGKPDIRLIISYTTTSNNISCDCTNINSHATIYTMAPAFSLILDQDVNEEIALMYPELYKDLTKAKY
ncbi:hypothetical protein F4703DRAFT_1794646 [Phycomyces blakesleeanus]